jgi:hypothetical protein
MIGWLNGRLTPIKALDGGPWSGASQAGKGAADGQVVGRRSEDGGKLVAIVANCEEMKQLPPWSKATVFMRKNLRQAIVDTKQEVEKVDESVNRLGIVTKEKKRKNDEVLLSNRK